MKNKQGIKLESKIAATSGILVGSGLAALSCYNPEFIPSISYGAASGAIFGGIMGGLGGGIGVLFGDDGDIVSGVAGGVAGGMFGSITGFIGGSFGSADENGYNSTLAGGMVGAAVGCIAGIGFGSIVGCFSGIHGGGSVGISGKLIKNVSKFTALTLSYGILSSALVLGGDYLRRDTNEVRSVIMPSTGINNVESPILQSKYGERRL